MIALRLLKKALQLAFALVLLLGLGLGVYIAANWQDARQFPKIISAYYAKEACTCLFVLEREEAQCHEMVRQYIPISQFSYDRAAQQVQVRGLGRSSTARYRGGRLGCQLAE